MAHTNSKANYIKIWHEEVKTFDLLLFTSDKKQQDSIKAIQQKLYKLILEIAETKTFTEVDSNEN